MGSSSAQAIIKARDAGPFTSLHDFDVSDRSGFDKPRGLESLITRGAFDSLANGETTSAWRARLLRQLTRSCHTHRTPGPTAFVASPVYSAGFFRTGCEFRIASCPEWSQAEVSCSVRKRQWAFIFQLIRLMSTHTAWRYEDHGRSRILANFASARTSYSRAIISSAQVRWSKKGNRFALQARGPVDGCEMPCLGGRLQ
jgi:DNA polymerase III alpha subunit